MPSQTARSGCVKVKAPRPQPQHAAVTQRPRPLADSCWLGPVCPTNGVKSSTHAGMRHAPPPPPPTPLADQGHNTTQRQEEVPVWLPSLNQDPTRASLPPWTGPWTWSTLPGRQPTHLGPLLLLLRNGPVAVAIAVGVVVAVAIAVAVAVGAVADLEKATCTRADLSDAVRPRHLFKPWPPENPAMQGLPLNRAKPDVGHGMHAWRAGWCLTAATHTHGHHTICRRGPRK